MGRSDSETETLIPTVQGGSFDGDKPIAFHPTQDPISSTDGSVHALGCGSKGGAASAAVAIGIGGTGLGYAFRATPSHSGDKGDGGVNTNLAVAFHENQRHELTESETAGSLKGGGGKPGQGYPEARIGPSVRRLTPVECERLMGWPDDHTIGFADSTRYKMCGNGIVAPCARWIGARIINTAK